ncbi:MAG TPA: hypothetical protein VMV73_03050, partial [Candidatus Dormibacteraeota bacterium]|nr:hypothetical protein [Candidatus Dormibacteraeota bacterium]
MKRRLSLALLLACFLTIVSPIQRGDAHFAVTIPLRSYCSAAIDSITPVKRRPGVWRYALTGNLPGSIAANLVLGTKHAWYAIQVSGVNLVDDTGTYRSNVLTFRRREYRSRAHFFVLPSGAGALLTAWVSAAGATDGSVLYACPRMPWFADESTTHKKTPWHADTYVRTNASVFDPNARPAATAALSLATTTTISGGDPT